MEKIDQTTPDLHRYELGLGRGTRVRLHQVGDLPAQGSEVKVEFDFIKRGRASNRRIKQSLRRFLDCALVISIAPHHDNKEDPRANYWRRRQSREMNWLRKNMSIELAQ
jgi:hypothetical protein